MVLWSYRASRIEFPLPVPLARRLISQARIPPPPPTGREGVIGHKVPCDTDTTGHHLIH
jgi:hypothetical protein